MDAVSFPIFPWVERHPGLPHVHKAMIFWLVSRFCLVTGLGPFGLRGLPRPLLQASKCIRLLPQDWQSGRRRGNLWSLEKYY